MINLGFIQLAMESKDVVSVRGNFSDEEALSFIKAILQERPDLKRKVNIKKLEDPLITDAALDLASKSSVDLAKVKGTGMGGSITYLDVKRVIENGD